MEAFFNRLAARPRRSILLLSLLLLLAGNWILPLTDRDEARFGEASREMMQRGDYVVPWGVFTRAIDRHPLPFLRFIRGWVRANVSMPAANYIDARNLRGIEWFNWLGFSVGDPVPYGLNDEPFREVRLN